MDEILQDADNKNKEGFANSLRIIGEDYIRYKNQIELAKDAIKGLLERAGREGINKDMIEAYAQALKLRGFDAEIFCCAVQQELFDDNKEQSDNQSN